MDVAQELSSQKQTQTLNRRKRQTSTSIFSLIHQYVGKKLINLADKIQDQEWQKRLEDEAVGGVSQIFTYTNKYELRSLYKIASSCPPQARALEIGSHLGASSCYIAAGLVQNDGHLFCVDTWNNETMPEGEQDTFATFEENISGVRQRVTPVRKRSEDLNADDIQAPLNFVFIDGDHSYTATKRDFETVKLYLAEDGIIAFHDFGTSSFEGVSRVVGEALASGEWMTLGQTHSLVWITPAKWINPTWLESTEKSTSSHLS